MARTIRKRLRNDMQDVIEECGEILANHWKRVGVITIIVSPALKLSGEGTRQVWGKGGTAYP